jgi:hypothetical protein
MKHTYTRITTYPPNTNNCTCIFNYFGINVKLDAEPDEIETKPIEINDSSKSRPRVVISEPIVSKNDDI